MFIAILAFVLLLVGYVSWHLWRIAPGGYKWGAMGVFVLWMITFFVGFFITERISIGAATVVYEVGNTWLIAFLYLLLIFIVADIVSLCHLLPKEYLKNSMVGLLAVIGIVTVIMAIGAFHYHHKYREEITVFTNKPLEKELTVVMASDLHLGYHNRKTELARWIDLFNDEKPDLVLIGGDIIDLSIRPVLEGNYAEEFRRTKAPVYAVLGNHEYFSDVGKAESFFKEAGIILLKDSVAHFNGLDIVGRNDRTNTMRKNLSELTADLNGFTILLDHQPYLLEEAEKAGIDFQFSGHTHRGQVWPISWITDRVYEKSWGHHRRGNTQYYISSGLGIWGPKIRIGTRSEYLVVHIVTDNSRISNKVEDGQNQ
ncbi:MAG: metallophosphoesterase [Bacteroidaceae bacterium]|nr:metallophosphoesterase [Bacteroidaceae bacterium]